MTKIDENMKKIIDDEHQRKRAALTFLQMALCESGEVCKLSIDDEGYTVTVEFPNGCTKKANVHADSCTAMMYDVLRQCFL